MSDLTNPGQPLYFTAVFPCDARFYPAVADLGARVAHLLGHAESKTADVRQAIQRGFEQAIAGADGADVTVEVRMASDGLAVAARVRCGPSTVLELTRSVPR